MNYWERWIGNYAKKTAHLSLAGHGAYSLLLDEYYAKERPLPEAYVDLYRICRAMTKGEQTTVREVADEFFPIDAGDQLRHNDKADQVIAKALPRLQSSRTNGKLGGRRKHNPDGNPEPNPDRTQIEPNGLPRSEPRSNPPRTRPVEAFPQTTDHKPSDGKVLQNPHDCGVALPGNLSRETWASWRSHLGAKGKGMTPQQERLQLTRLAEHSDQEAVVRRAIEKGHSNLEPIGGWGKDSKPATLAEERAKGIDAVISQGGKRTHERTIEGTAERVDSEAFLSLPHDLRQSR